MMFRIKYVLGWAIVSVLWLGTLLAGCEWILQHAKMIPARSITGYFSCAAAAQKTNQSGFSAKHNLAANHWIREEDLDWTSSRGGAQKADFINRFSACPVQSGETLVLSETRELPKMEARSDRLTYRLGVTDVRAIQSMNAGSRVDIWDENHQIAQKLLVLALLCTPGAPPKDCSAILDVSPEEFSRLRGSKAESLLIIPR
jgi:hypothetical protein